MEASDDYHALAAMIRPRISPVQAKGAIDYLEKNGFLKRNESGRWEQTSNVISSGDEVESAILARYHQVVLRQCADAVGTVPRTKRDISSVTLSVSKPTYLEIKKEIQLFRKKLLTMAAADQAADRVCLVSLALLPRALKGDADV